MPKFVASGFVASGFTACRPLIVAGLLLGCAEPAVLRAPPGGPTMPEPVAGVVPLPALAEPTGGPLIALPPNQGPGPTALSPNLMPPNLAPAASVIPSAAPRSGRGATP